MSLLDLWLSIHNYILTFFGYDGRLHYVKTATNQTNQTETEPIETNQTETNPVEDNHSEIKGQAINGC